LTLFFKKTDDAMNNIHPSTSVSFPILGISVVSFTVFAILLCLSPDLAMAKTSPVNEPDINQLLQGKAYVYKLDPEGSAGKGYKLVYMVAASLKAFWKFKNDFKNDFLLTNKLIAKHRLVAHKNNVAITESIYVTKPGVKFRWRTTSFPDIYRLNFELQNPKECGQKFHYGHIRLEAAGEHTKVTQVAYFEFFGATLWMNYPWYGGMRHYLHYTARWEQETITRLIDRYR
jgi:hypothetical protein